MTENRACDPWVLEKEREERQAELLGITLRSVWQQEPNWCGIDRFTNFPVKINVPIQQMLEIPIKLLSPDAKMPTKAHETDAGFDLYSVEDFQVDSAKVTKVKTGVAINIPVGYVGLIQDKSGHGSKGLKIFGGVIDAGYIGEIIICFGLLEASPIANIAQNSHNLCQQRMHFAAGQKIAQLVILPLPSVIFKEVDSFEQTERAEKGFGSSGL